MGQKLVTKTNEWKEAAAKRENSMGSLSTQSFDPLGGLRTHSMPTDAHHSGPAPDMMQHGGMPPNAATNGMALQQPMSPRQFQHERWSQLLQQKIMTVQEFLMALEAKESEGTVPKEIWEALADMDRMQRELHNYSRNMAAPPY